MKTSICPTCGGKFEHIRNKKYCNPKCYTKYQRGEFPSFTCQKCGFIWKLKFDPNKDKGKFRRLRCPNCRTCKPKHDNYNIYD